MSTKDQVLAAVRHNRPAGDFPLPEVKTFPIPGDDDRVGLFLRTLDTMGGTYIDVKQQRPTEVIRAAFPNAANVVSATPEVASDRDLGTVEHQADLQDVDVAVVRATLGVAETGSVLLTHEDLRVNALGYLAQHLVVLLDPADIVPGLQDAYLSPEFGRHGYAVFHTGPSATADIEGVLIHGAQGVRSLNVLLVPRPAQG